MDLELEKLRAEIDSIHREIVELLARRVEISVEIGRIKSDRGVDLRSIERETDLLAGVRAEAERLGLDQEVVTQWFERIVEYSRRRQDEALGDQ
jgi:chorismate mutase